MGWAQRRTGKLLGLMVAAKWWNRVRVYAVFANQATPPPALRGTRGVKWLVTGKLDRRRYAR